MAEIDALGPTEVRAGDPGSGGDEGRDEAPDRPSDTGERQLALVLRMLPVGAESSEPEDAHQSLDTADRHLAQLLQGVRGGLERATGEPAMLRGRTLGRYLVLGKLGQGGMGTVLKAYDESLDRAIAIKLLHSEAAERHAMRLRREAQALAKLSHPNIVHVYEVGENDGQWFIAMELVPGQTLRQWQQDKARSWKDCVKVYLQAGEGLAAAHAVGLVHRDFKPDNCIIDGKGRPRVLDFGLVGGTTLPPGEAVVSEPELEALRVESVDASLTSTGTVMGTPAYMPPEQMNGLEADARSDQFSFCVSLYEAVYGERPFAGTSMMQLSAAMTTKGVRPAPKGTHVPNELRRILVRGLSIDPGLRWSSLEALLDALRPLVMPRRGRWIALSVGVGLVAIGGGLATGELADRIERCSGARAQLEGIWDEARRQEVKTAILGTSLSYAPGTWERVEPRLDAYADAWAQQHTEACEATRARGEQSEEQMILRMGCLAERRLHVRATVNELARADATTVKNAVQAVTSLPRLERCSDMAALEAEIPPPEDPTVAERVAQLDERLVEAKARQNAGRYDEALAVADGVEAEAATLDYEPLMARVWLMQGTFREQTDDFEGSATMLRQAFDAALARRMMKEAAEASVTLVSVYTDLARYEEARRWAVVADPLARAVGIDEAQASYLESLGHMAYHQGNLDEARDFHERGLAIREKALGPDHLDVASSLIYLGTVAKQQGNLDEARELHERALAIYEEALGPDHPDVALTLTSLGSVAHTQGKLDEARVLYERALAIYEKALGPCISEMAKSLANLGGVAREQGKLDEARVLYERALAINEEALGPDHPDMAWVLTGLGNVAHTQGKLDEARVLYERALAIYEKALGPDHPDVAAPLNNLGGVARAQGKLDEARDLLERALAINEKALGPHHPQVALVLNNLGSVALTQGKLDETRDLLERALAISEEALGPDHPNVAEMINGLGGVAYTQGKLDEARVLYERSLAIYEKALGPDNPDLAFPLTKLGETLLELGMPAEAFAALERALTIRTTHDVDPRRLALTRFKLARGLWTVPATQGRDRPRARLLAEQARDAWAELGEATPGNLVEVEQWLVEHRVR